MYIYLAMRQCVNAKHHQDLVNMPAKTMLFIFGTFTNGFWFTHIGLETDYLNFIPSLFIIQLLMLVSYLLTLNLFNHEPFLTRVDGHCRISILTWASCYVSPMNQPPQVRGLEHRFPRLPKGLLPPWLGAHEFMVHVSSSKESVPMVDQNFLLKKVPMVNHNQ